MNSLLRPIALADEPFLWEMLYQGIYVPPGISPPSRDILHLPEIRRYVEGWDRIHDLGFVAIDPEKAEPIGAAWLRLLTGENRGYGYVDDTTPELTIAVVPEHRGRGVGTELLWQLLRAAQSRYPSVCLSVSPDNPAFRWYERLGFETVGESGTSLVMRRGSPDH